MKSLKLIICLSLTLHILKYSWTFHFGCFNQLTVKNSRGIGTIEFIPCLSVVRKHPTTLTCISNITFCRRVGMSTKRDQY